MLSPDAVTAYIRTAVAIVAGSIVSWALRHGLNMDQAAVQSWLTPVVSAVYFVAVHAVERVFPAAGFLLGIPKAPSYGTPPAR